jgi:hypothetical protein
VALQEIYSRIWSKLRGEVTHKRLVVDATATEGSTTTVVAPNQLGLEVVANGGATLKFNQQGRLTVTSPNGTTQITEAKLENTTNGFLVDSNGYRIADAGLGTARLAPQGLGFSNVKTGANAGNPPLTAIVGNTLLPAGIVKGYGLIVTNGAGSFTADGYGGWTAALDGASTHIIITPPTGLLDTGYAVTLGGVFINGTLCVPFEVIGIGGRVVGSFKVTVVDGTTNSFLDPKTSRIAFSFTLHSRLA